MGTGSQKGIPMIWEHPCCRAEVRSQLPGIAEWGEGLTCLARTPLPGSPWRPGGIRLGMGCKWSQYHPCPTASCMHYPPCLSWG